MPDWFDTNLVSVFLGVIVTLFVIAQAGMLLPYRVSAIELKIDVIEKRITQEVADYAKIRQDLAILRRDIEWLVRILAKETGVEVPPFVGNPDPSN